MNRKTPSIVGAAVGLALFLAIALLPALLYGGYAGVMLAGGIFGMVMGVPGPEGCCPGDEGVAEKFTAGQRPELPPRASCVPFPAGLPGTSSDLTESDLARPKPWLTGVSGEKQRAVARLE